MRRIVFASGKGGTGKTTLTALVARLLSDEGRSLVLADCDVEAANLPIALEAEVVTRDPFTGSPKAIVDPAACRGCGACRIVCRFDAIGPDGDFFRSRSFAVDPLVCEGCGACVPACSDRAIRMVPTQAGEVLTATTSVGPMTFGRLAAGEDLSGKLVTEVRGRADRIAAESASNLMLIDGPPGVGCPAIAALTGTGLVVAVTEPTVSGEHDLMRLVALARRFTIPVRVALNKADLSHPGAERLRERVRGEGLEMLAEIPYDESIARIPALLATGALSAYPDGPALEAVRRVARATDLS